MGEGDTVLDKKGILKRNDITPDEYSHDGNST